MYKAVTALAASLFLSAALVAPAQAAPPDLAEGAEDAVTAVIPQAELTGEVALEADSDLAAGEKLKIDVVEFGGGESVTVSRTVGAVREVAGDTPAGRIVQTTTVQRKKAGKRKVRFVSTADEYGPGLTGATWTERTGVNYSVVARDPVDRKKLLEIVKALPADPTQAPKKARRLIEKAGPPARAPERSAASQVVDGAGVVNDDWGDEATLCNGCAYSNSNYTWLWQKVVIADGIGLGLDCAFGAQTANATKTWQSSYGLGSDGVVGQATRGLADNGLWLQGGSSVFYDGSASNVYFERLTGNAYFNYNGTKKIAYTYTSLC